VSEGGTPAVLPTRTEGGWERFVVPAFATALVAASFLVFLLSARQFDATRPDFFYLADAFVHGRTWLDQALGPYDDVFGPAGRVYVPFAPFPALVLIPLVGLVGPAQATLWQPIVNAGIAAADVGLAFWLAARAGVTTTGTRFALAVLLGFSTAIWWVTTRGGVWHTGHLVATFLTLCALIETFGRRRPLLLGLLGGAAFLTRAPLIFALPLYALVLPPPDGDAPWWHPRAWPIRGWVALGLGVLPSVAFFLWYDWVRFGSPFESGYALATLPDWLAAQRAQGLFSTVHLGMNLDFLFLHRPALIPTFPFFQPDGLGMSILLTSPGLGLAALAPWRSGLARALGMTAVIVLIPSLLYYGGGWLQYGYRYALDTIPFVLALCALAAAKRGLGWGWRAAIAFGLVINLGGVYWAYHL
jgi:hypothetical protein